MTLIDRELLTDSNQRRFIIISLLFYGKLVGENQEIRLFSENVGKSVFIYEPCTVIQSQDTRFSIPITIHCYH